MEAWREFLYPLGFLSALAFTSRVLLQWIGSELKGKSSVTPLFWKTSICGNCLLALHALIQIQFHVCLIQTCNAVIAWRNLNLMGSAPYHLRTILWILYGAIFSVFLIFSLQGYFFLELNASWFRIPITPWQNQPTPLSFAWHMMGFAGLALFSSRYWVQWWCAERRKESYLGASFWWASLVGELISLIYFLTIGDAVNFIGPLFAFIPYVRNLMLIYKKQPSQGVG